MDQQSLFGTDDSTEPEPPKATAKAAAAPEAAHPVAAPAVDGPMTRLVVATDGSCLRNPGPGGWCWYANDDCWSAGGEEETTNNRMELLAVLSLLEAVPVGRPVHVMADSSYVIDALTKWRHGWKRKNWRTSSGEPVKNRDLMERLDSLMDTHSPTFEWVKGHQGHVENEAADIRARTVAESIQSGLNDWDPGPGLTC